MCDRQANPHRAVTVWLVFMACAVAAMVSIGGITRLTESGLSMVEWRPLIGWLPPLSEAEWQRIFALYRETPEFRQINFAIELDGFKAIFWWEYIHRLSGRLLGLFFAVPLAWFWFRGRIDRPLRPRLLLLLALGGLQGLIGWWMVRSGWRTGPMSARRGLPSISAWRWSSSRSWSGSCFKASGRGTAGGRLRPGCCSG